MIHLSLFKIFPRSRLNVNLNYYYLSDKDIFEKMTQKVTKGIRVSVKTHYQGSFLKNEIPNYAFRYTVTIQNQSKDVVQLIKRHWKIMQSEKETQNIEGFGVAGKKPIIKSGGAIQYESGCVLNSRCGAMKGFYIMINHRSTEEFQIEIPAFTLETPFSLN